MGTISGSIGKSLNRSIRAWLAKVHGLMVERVNFGQVTEYVVIGRDRCLGCQLPATEHYKMIELDKEKIKKHKNLLLVGELSKG